MTKHAIKISLILMLFSGCEALKPQPQIIKEYYRKDSIIQGATIRDSFPFPIEIKGKDSVIIRNHWYTVKDTNGRAELRYMIDQYGQLILECQSKDAQIERMVERISEVKSAPKPPKEKGKWPIHELIILALSLGIFFTIVLRK
jgi:hypothetical protein